MNASESTLDQSQSPSADAARSTSSLRRYAQERKTVIRDRAMTVAATLVVLLIGLFGWRYDSHRRLGQIILTNHGVPLLAQLLPESGDEPVDRLEMRNMPAIEHYSRTGWYLAILPGAFVVGALTLLAWPISRMSRWTRWRAMRMP